MTYLILEDGSAYQGKSFGAVAPSLDKIKTNKSCGELIFNTSMVGYQEIISDPSYEGQIVTFTYPHIGNYGIDVGGEENIINSKINCNAVVVKNYYDGPVAENRITLDQYLKESDVIGICNVNTRALTLHLRDTGFKRAIIVECDNLGKVEKDFVVQHLLSFPFISSLNPVESVSCTKIIEDPEINSKIDVLYDSKKHFALVDFGIKKSIIKSLYRRGVRVTLLPPTFSEEDVLNHGYSALFLSNGPGDPEMQSSAIKTVRALLNKIPIMGICLGHQIITLALGGKTEKMSFGHHGGNQPVTDLETGRTFVTSQNHSFVSSSLSDECKVWFINSNDRSIEGIKVPSKSILSVQFHPEAGPGPREGERIFDEFIKESK
ncbi:MAG: glutamine-hydrolyzing carbamoyl-phosphate synthase small subunit [Sphaerochaeta sp.]